MSDMIHIPAGRKGGGKGGGGGTTRAAQEDPNTLRSKRVARVLDLLGEGPIVGLADGAKSIFLDDTPLQTEGGAYNFNGVTVQSVLGYPDQDPLPGFPAAEQTQLVGVEISAGVPVVRAIDDENLDAVRVTVRVPSLTKQDTETGDLHGASVRVQVFVTATGGPRTLMRDHTISGKTTSPYEISYRIPLTGSAPWNVELVRVTADSDEVTLQNETWWSSYTEIIDAKFSYPDCAIVGLTVDAELFGNAVPSRGYEIKGRILQVPSNYDPATRAYTGIWDGTFKAAWSDNPAWVLYDMLTHERYGLGEFVQPALVDKWSLYTIAQYCDELVDDGFGGQEPRYTFNGVIADRREAYAVINSIASAFRGMVYWANGLVMPTQDAPSDPVKLVSRANVTDGEIAYSGAALKARHSVALVTWNDPADGYRPAIEVVEDQDAIERFGYRETSIVAFGCTSRGQAHRVGRWLLYTNQHETETASYGAGLDHADLRPGEVISLADDTIAGARFGGRLKAVSQAPAGDFWQGTILPSDAAYLVTQDGNGRYTVDRNNGDYVNNMGEITLPTVQGAAYRLTLPNPQPSHQYRVWVGGEYFDNINVIEFVAAGATTRLQFATTYSVAATLSFDVPTLVRTEPTELTLDSAPDLGTLPGWTLMLTAPDGGLVSRELTSIDGNVVTLSAPLEEPPIVGSMWLLTSGIVEPRQFRVRLNAEEEGHLFRLTALEHDPNKYAIVEEGLKFDPPSYTTIPVGDLPSPSSISVFEYLYRQGLRVAAGMTISFTPPADPRVAYFQVDVIRPGEPDYSTIGYPTSGTIDLRDAHPGVYEIRVWSFTALGIRSPRSRHFQYVNQGTLAPPDAPTNLTVDIVDGSAILKWTGATNLDLSHSEVRYSPVLSGAIWQNMQVVLPRVSKETHTGVVQARNGSYMVKSVDQSGIYSEAAALAVVTSALFADLNVVATFDDAPEFGGIHSETVVKDGSLRLASQTGLELVGGGRLGLLTGGYVRTLTESAFVGEGVYQTLGSVDLGAIYTGRLTYVLTAAGDNINNTIGGWTRLDLVDNISGATSDQWSVEPEMRISLDGVTWADWEPMAVGYVSARQIEFRLRLMSNDPVVTPDVDCFEVSFDMPDRVERGADIVCPAAGIAVAFAPAYFVKPAIAVDGQGMNPGDRYVRSGESRSGFTLQFFDDLGTPVERTFDWIAAGYGRAG